MNVEKMIQSEKKNLVYGTDKTIRLLKQGELKAAVYSLNTPSDVVKKLDEAKNDTEVYEYDGSSSRLGTICGRAHIISVLGIKK